MYQYSEINLRVPQAIQEKSGKIYLVPSSIKPGEITRVMREGYDARQLTEGFRRLLTELKLDYLLIDTHPGLGEETLLSLVISNTLLIVMRPDQQDYEGTGITVRIAQELKVPNILLLVNKAPSSLEPAALAEKVRLAYGCRVSAVLPHSDEMMELASRDLFTLKFPTHPITDRYREVAALLPGYSSSIGRRWRLSWPCLRLESNLRRCEAAVGRVLCRGRGTYCALVIRSCRRSRASWRLASWVR